MYMYISIHTCKCLTMYVYRYIITNKACVSGRGIIEDSQYTIMVKAYCCKG